jgi:NAD(P)-dependent dehydrogenase (short-subunit alcohol dehydrogenase family)
VKGLRDRVAVVTGAASGIGRPLAARFAAEGMTVTLADIDEAALTQAVEELAAAGADVAAMRVDVTRAQEAMALADLRAQPAAGRPLDGCQPGVAGAPCRDPGPRG